MATLRDAFTRQARLVHEFLAGSCGESALHKHAAAAAAWRDGAGNL
jgi:hypothetical protein